MTAADAMNLGTRTTSPWPFTTKTPQDPDATYAVAILRLGEIHSTRTLGSRGIFTSDSP